MKWKKPSHFGDGDFKGYLVEKRKEGSDLWLPVNKHPEMCLEEHYRADNLVKGNTYFFRVFAVNVYGKSLPSLQSCFVKPGEPYDPDVIERQEAMFADRKRKLAEEEAYRLAQIEKEKLNPFSTSLQDYWAVSGESAHFEIEVKDPTWEVTWSFGNHQEVNTCDPPTGRYNVISIGNVRKLIITDCTPEDVAVVNVTCFKKTAQADLMVDNIAPAHFIQELYDQDCPKGETCTMRVTITQDIAELKWYKQSNLAGVWNEITIDDIGDHYQIINQGHTRALIITGLTYDDIAAYEVRGPGGISRCNLSVDGFHPIHFEQPGLEDQLHVKHTAEFVIFETTVIPSHKDGYKQPALTWLYDDQPGFHLRDGRDGREVNFDDDQFRDRLTIISVGCKRILRIECPRWDDSGRWTIYHPGGFASCILKVQPPPPPPAPPLPCAEDTILHFRKGLRAEHKIGGSRLYTEVENLPDDIIIKWTKNGREIIEDQRHTFIVDFNTGVVSVEIDDIDNSDEGKYQVSFVTPLGMFDTRVNYDFTGDLFKAIKRKALDLVDEEQRLADMKANPKKQEPEPAETVHADIVSDHVEYELQSSGSLAMWVKIDQQTETMNITWYKNGTLLENCPETEYHISETTVSLYISDASTGLGQYDVHVDDGRFSANRMLDLTEEMIK